MRNSAVSKISQNKLRKHLSEVKLILKTITIPQLRFEGIIQGLKYISVFHNQGVSFQMLTGRSGQSNAEKPGRSMTIFIMNSSESFARKQRVKYKIMYNITSRFNFCSLGYSLLGKGGYVFGGVGLSVCLFVCLFVNNITQKVMNGLE